MAKMKAYAGIGSRKTPEDVKGVMRSLATRLEQEGWVLRSGGAVGADQAFEGGVLAPHNKQVFIPGHATGYRIDATRLPEWGLAMELVDHYHPAPGQLSGFSRKLMARNAFQVLGPDLKTPSKMVIAWAPGGYEGQKPPSGAREGGTGQALRIARDNGIPIRNLANRDTLQRAIDWLNRPIL